MAILGRKWKATQYIPLAVAATPPSPLAQLGERHTAAREAMNCCCIFNLSGIALGSISPNVAGT